MTDDQNDSQSALQEWLKSRKPKWENLEIALNPKKKKLQDGGDEARELINGYRMLMGDLSLSRRINQNSLITRYLENLFLKLNEEIHRPAFLVFERILKLYNEDAPRLMRQLNKSLLFSFLIFLFGILSGWLLIHSFPDLISLIASTEMINHVQSGELWTDDLLNIMPSSILSISIAANNIAVSLSAFVFGALYGIGTLYIIGLNGFMLGGVFAFTNQYGLSDRLFHFVFPHGTVELSIIIISGAMGLQLGEALIRPGKRNRLQAFRITCTNTGIIMLTATPFLLYAGFIEGFVSPNSAYELPARLVIGCFGGLAFWLVMLFGLPRKTND